MSEHAAQLHEIKDSFFEGQFFEINDGRVHFLDIVHNTPFSSLNPPQSVLDEPLLAQGFATLARLGRQQRVHVPLLLGAHGDAQNFTDIADRYESLLANTVGVGVEMSWTSKYADSPTLDTIELETCGAEGREQFQRAEMAWLAERAITILPCEIQSDSESPLASAFATLESIYKSATSSGDIADTVTRNIVRSLATSIYQANRHWTIVGQYGYWLQDLDSCGALEDNNGAMLPLVLGSWHAPSIQKLQSFAVATEIYPTPDHILPTSDYERYGDTFMRMIGTNTATFDQLSTPLPYE